MRLRGRHHFYTWIAVSLILSLASFSGLLKRAQDSLTDLLFTRKTPPANIVIVEIDETSINRTGQWPWPRAVFGDLVGKLQSAAVIGIDVNFKEPSRLGPQDDWAFASALGSSRIPVVLTAEMGPDGILIPPVSPLDTNSQNGFPNLVLSSDGIARVIRYKKGSDPSFSLRISEEYAQWTLHKPLGVVPSELTRIDFQGPDRTFPLVSAWEVQEGKIPSVFFKDKIILIGATARDLQDFHHTPMGIVSGVEVQASIITTLLNQRFFTGHFAITMTLIILLSALTIGLGMRIKRLRLYMAALAAIIIGYNIVAFIAFDHYLILDLLYPNLAIFGSAIASITVQYFFAHKEKKFIQDSFSRYLAPQVIHEILHDPSKLKLGGKKETLTILFSDIRNFTTMSESMSPEQLTSFLNDYLSRMTHIVLERNGVIDKYIGDAIMAFWGAPLSNPRHAADGILSALHMVEELQAFNEHNKTKNNPIVDIGIGLNSGEVTVGNMGSEKRFDYTVMGDNVNLASRLESLTKTYGVNILISKSTADLITPEDRAQHGIRMREIDRVQVKGKKLPVTMFEVIPRSKQEAVASILEWFEAGRNDYYKGNFKRAIDMFDKVLEKVSNDGPSHVLRERCETFLQTPHANWQGIYEMTSK